jgi:hypothetical protein
MLPLGDYLHRIAPVAAMVINGNNTQNKKQIVFFFWYVFM